MKCGRQHVPAPTADVLAVALAFLWQLHGRPPPGYKSMTALENRVYQFKGFASSIRPSIDLLADGTPIALTPKVFGHAWCLRSAPARRQQGRTHPTPWPRGATSMSPIYQHIWLIRRASGTRRGGLALHRDGAQGRLPLVAAVTVREREAVRVPEPRAAPPELAHVGTVLPVGRPDPATARPWYIAPDRA